MQVDFYHLTSMPLERALPRIAERVLAGGARLLIVAADEAQRIALDRLLWDYAPESFLPHGRLGTGDDATQPQMARGISPWSTANGATMRSTSSARSISSTKTASVWRVRHGSDWPAARGWNAATGSRTKPDGGNRQPEKKSSPCIWMGRELSASGW
jgi:DNA polymerase-3 subunit chi